MAEINFEEDVNNEAATEGELSRIATLVGAYQRALDEVSRLEESLKEAEKMRDRLSSLDIPNAMDEAGMSEITLRDGSKVKIESVTRGHITKANQEAAFQWLQDNGYGDIIKAELKVGVGRGETDQLADLAEVVMSEFGWSPDVKQSIHPQTLYAFIRERRAEGDDMPEDLLGVTEFRQTKVG